MLLLALGFVFFGLGEAQAEELGCDEGHVDSSRRFVDAYAIVFGGWRGRLKVVDSAVDNAHSAGISCPENKLKDNRR